MRIRFNNGKQRTINILTIFAVVITSVLSLAFALHKDSKPAKEWVIVIDPGHGGKDPGAVGKFSYEKNIVLPVALRTGELIRKNIPGVKVIFTRDNDTFVELGERANIANKNQADLFISVHANGNPSSGVRGTETFIMGLTKDEANLAVAMKENEVMLLEQDYSTKYEGFDPKSPESYIIFTLMQNVYREQSTNLAAMIQNQYKERVSRADRGVQEAGFYVLFMTTMPSVLTEIGFITNPTEEKFLNSKEGQEYIASAIYRACRDYINDVNSKSGISVTGQAAAKETEKVIAAEEARPVPGEYSYRVQIAASKVKKSTSPENFNGLNEVKEISSGGIFKYFSGDFTSYDDAANHRKEIASLYPGAFVIAVKGDKIVPLQEALDKDSR
ncbi:MAG: N-acetylmuramoyl-L-alanine amidase [Bacteroidales bacterium]|nr:N-acetylmuramoyl-L-alanine amidase [Bacteroidales bacterium]